MWPALVRGQSWRQAEGLDRQLNGAGAGREEEWHLRQALLPGCGGGLRLSQAALMAAHQDLAGNRSSAGRRSSLCGGQAAGPDGQGGGLLVLR